MIRKLITQKEEDRNRNSSILQKKLFRTAVFKKAKCVMFYIAFGGEVETQHMIEKAIALGKRIVVPTCKAGGEILPACLTKGSVLVRGTFGVREPAVKRCIHSNEIDVVIVPGLAFDKKGNRLGRGKGCYDAFLTRLPPSVTSIGLAFDFQILPTIPTTQRDMRVKKVIFA